MTTFCLTLWLKNWRRRQGAFAEDHDGDQPGVHYKKGARSRRISTRIRARRHSGPNDVEQVAFEEEQVGDKTGEHNKKGAGPGRPSTRRNRDYSHHITWTYEMNKDLYECSEKADETVYGYSGKLKKLWDKHCSKYLLDLKAKHLAPQAKPVKDKGLIAEAKIKTNDTTQDNNSTQLQDATITTENNQEQNSNITVEDNVDQQGVCLWCRSQ